MGYSKATKKCTSNTLPSGRVPIAQIPPSAPGSSRGRSDRHGQYTGLTNTITAFSVNACHLPQSGAASYMSLLLHCKEINANCQRNFFFFFFLLVVVMLPFGGCTGERSLPPRHQRWLRYFSAHISSLGQGNNQPMQPFVIFQDIF